MFGFLGEQPEDDWRRQAQCYLEKERVQELNKQLGYDMFYPPAGKTDEALKWSKRFCDRCPVKVPCFNEGVSEKGTWGGETYTRRKQLVRQFRIDPSILLAQRLGLSQDENKDHNEVSNPDPESK